MEKKQQAAQSAPGDGAQLARRGLLCFEPIDSGQLGRAVAAILNSRPKIRIDAVNGEPALGCGRVGELAAMRFQSDGRSLVYDGLPGPMPARAAAIAQARAAAPRPQG